MVIGPWLFGGDFNEVLSHSEKVGGNDKSNWAIFNFYLALSNCELQDLGYTGPMTT